MSSGHGIVEIVALPSEKMVDFSIYNGYRWVIKYASDNGESLKFIDS